MDRVDSLVTPVSRVLVHRASLALVHHLDSVVIRLLSLVLLALAVTPVFKVHLDFQVSAQVLVSQDTQV